MAKPKPSLASALKPCRHTACSTARDPASYLPKGRGNGYVVTIGGKRIYFAGNTECTPEMKNLKNIDVAFLPLQMPQTMQPYDAGECSKAFLPKIVYIYHYDGQKQDEAFFRASLKGTPIDVRVQTK